MSRSFRHRDGEQLVFFGTEALTAAADHLTPGFTLLTTPRASAAAPSVAAAAEAVVEVPHGAVDEVAAELLAQIRGERIVALGGGRVIDVAKAVAAAEGLRGPVAIPTSLSGAEMTGVHRHARGVPESTPRVRATVVVNDPALSASQPHDALAASSANALGHAVTAAAGERSSPMTVVVAHEAVRRLVAGWASGDPHREAVAEGALLAGWSVDRSGLGLHHALAQTAVRIGRLGHAEVNAAVLPHALRALRERAPEALAQLDRDAGGSIDGFAARLHALAGAPSLAGLTQDASLLDDAVATATRRPELAKAVPPLGGDAIRRLYLAASEPTG